MPQASWSAVKGCSIDEFFAVASAQALTVGITISGGAKATKSRALLAFDLTADPVAGVRPGPGETLQAAQVDATCTVINGASGSACHAYRLTRDDWYGFNRTNWTNYKGAGVPGDPLMPWTAPGGDYDAPSGVAFNSPTALAPWTIPGLLPLVQEAIAHHTNVLSLVLRLDAESAAVTQQFDSAYIGTAGEPLLVLTYGGAHTLDEPDLTPATIRPGASASAPSPPASAGRASQGARPARPHRS